MLPPNSPSSDPKLSPSAVHLAHVVPQLVLPVERPIADAHAPLAGRLNAPKFTSLKSVLCDVMAAKLCRAVVGHAEARSPNAFVSAIIQDDANTEYTGRKVVLGSILRHSEHIGLMPSQRDEWTATGCFCRSLDGSPGCQRRILVWNVLVIAFWIHAARV
jgi:hypothetical protein